MIFNSSMMPPIDRINDQYRGRALPQGTGTQEAQSFADILSTKQERAGRSEELHFSKHAANRLNDRDIALTNDQMERLSLGTQKAQAKGIKESLVLVDDLAFIVNIKNNTVVTALDSTKADESVYTNIDGAVIA